MADTTMTVDIPTSTNGGQASGSGLDAQQRLEGRQAQGLDGDELPSSKRTKLGPTTTDEPQALEPVALPTIRETPQLNDDRPTNIQTTNQPPALPNFDESERHTLSGLSISKVKLVRTKRGQTIDIYVNEDTTEDRCTTTKDTPSAT